MYFFGVVGEVVLFEFFLERFVEAEDSISFFFVFCFEQTFGFPRLLRAPMCGCESIRGVAWKGSGRKKAQRSGFLLVDLTQPIDCWQERKHKKSHITSEIHHKYITKHHLFSQFFARFLCRVICVFWPRSTSTKKPTLWSSRQFYYGWLGLSGQE